MFVKQQHKKRLLLAAMDAGIRSSGQNTAHPLVDNETAVNKDDVAMQFNIKNALDWSDISGLVLNKLKGVYRIITGTSDTIEIHRRQASAP